jgi:hypothetical protein
MREELDQKLCEKYPKIFVNRDKSMQETAMCWGFSHGDGWYNIINQLCANIQHHIDWSVKNNKWDLDYNTMITKAMAGDITDLEDYYKGYFNAEERMAEVLEKGLTKVRPVVPQVVADQVKEKFGTLRFYYHGGDEYIHGLAAMAESMSAVTCEDCGAPGQQRQGGWIRTLCDHHEAEHQRIQQERTKEYARDREQPSYKFVHEDSGSHD